MNRLPTMIAAIVLALVLVTYMCTFQVRSTEVAILKTAGRPSGEPFTEPGLEFKWPWPIQSVVKYDNRKRLLEDTTEETGTGDGKNVTLTTYTVWRIADPRKFHENFQVEETGATQLRSIIQTSKNAEVGRRYLNEFIAVEDKETPGRRPIEDIEASILRRVKNATEKEYGVEILAFGIKKLGVPKSVSTSIFDSMKAAQELKANVYLGEGRSAAQAIRSRADAARMRILAQVNRKVAQIEAEGKDKVSQYYSQFEYPELRIFLDHLEVVKNALARRSTIILSTEAAPFSVFTPEGRQAILDGKTSASAVSISPAPASEEQEESVKD